MIDEFSILLVWIEENFPNLSVRKLFTKDYLIADSITDEQYNAGILRIDLEINRGIYVVRNSIWNKASDIAITSPDYFKVLRSIIDAELSIRFSLSKNSGHTNSWTLH